MSFKQRFVLSAATAAIVAALPTASQAACSIEGTVIECDGDVTASDVTNALNTVGGSDMTLTFTETANVSSPGFPLSPAQQGAVTINNAGTFGSGDFNDGIFLRGNSADGDNNVAFTNSGDFNGYLDLSGIGGAVAITSSGSVGGRINVDGAGDQTATINDVVGTLDSNMVPRDLRTVTLHSNQSQSIPFTNNVESDADGVETRTLRFGFTATGGTTSISAGSNAQTGTLFAIGLEGATVSSNGRVGSENFTFSGIAAESSGSFEETIVVTITDGPTVRTERTDTRRSLGGTADVTVGESSKVSGAVNALGLGDVSVEVLGSVGTRPSDTNIRATSSGSERVSVTIEDNIDGARTTTFTRNNQTSGGTADVVIAEGATVVGAAVVGGFEGANLTVDGVFQAGPFAFFEVESEGSTSSFEVETRQPGDGSFFRETEETSTQTGGDATVSVGSSGVIDGQLLITADSNGAISNQGLITGTVSVGTRARNTVETDTTNEQNFQNSTQANRTITTDVGGIASVDNAAGAAIGPADNSFFGVFLSGNEGASVTNGGRINGDVSITGTATEFDFAQSFSNSLITDANTQVATQVRANGSDRQRTNLGGCCGLHQRRRRPRRW